MSDKNHRDAKNGQFVTEKTTKSRPSTTLSEKRGGEPTNRERSSKTGQFVPDGTAKRRPATTVKEK
jgi:hypothetical protein